MKATAEWELSRIWLHIKENELCYISSNHHINNNDPIQSVIADLTLEQAENLAQDILNACQEYRQFDDELNRYFATKTETSD